MSCSCCREPTLSARSAAWVEEAPEDCHGNSPFRHLSLSGRVPKVLGVACGCRGECSAPWTGARHCHLLRVVPGHMLPVDAYEPQHAPGTLASGNTMPISSLYLCLLLWRPRVGLLQAAQGTCWGGNPALLGDLCRIVEAFLGHLSSHILDQLL